MNIIFCHNSRFHTRSSIMLFKTSTASLKINFFDRELINFNLDITLKTPRFLKRYRERPKRGINKLTIDLKQAHSALRKNFGIFGYRSSRKFEERASKILGRAKKREGLVSSVLEISKFLH